MNLNLKQVKKKLKKGYTKTGGRNNQGKIVSFKRGGGHKKMLRDIDFKQKNYTGRVLSIDYDPIRSAFIALVFDKINNKYKYILASENTKLNDELIFNLDKKNTSAVNNVNILNDSLYKIDGNRFKLKDIPLNTYIHNIELNPNSKAILARSAGTFGILLQKQKKYVKIKLPSNEVRSVLETCAATIGKVSNKNHKNKTIKKAGRNRWLNKKPTVRGVAMNPVDHPHGGGEGKTSGGRHPVTPWGRLSKGKKTVIKKSKFILIKKK